jgi:hypothetical protein
MSTLHNTLQRLGAWAYRRRLTIFAGVAVVWRGGMFFASSVRLYEERQARLDDIEALTAENDRQNIEQCEGLNGSNQTLRELLDASIRRRPAESFSAEDRRLAVDTYRRLPHTDCTTGEKHYFDPPFPPSL